MTGEHGTGQRTTRRRRPLLRRLAAAGAAALVAAAMQLLSITGAAAAPARGPGAPAGMSVPAGTLPAMATFAVLLVHGPGWDPSRPIRQQDAWTEHAAFMDGLVDDGFLIIGGPLSDGERTLHAMTAPGEQEIRARLAEDPWAASGKLRVGSIEPWALWLDSRSRAR